MVSMCFPGQTGDLQSNRASPKAEIPGAVHTDWERKTRRMAVEDHVHQLASKPGRFQPGSDLLPRETESAGTPERPVTVEQ